MLKTTYKKNTYKIAKFFTNETIMLKAWSATYTIVFLNCVMEVLHDEVVSLPKKEECSLKFYFSRQIKRHFTTRLFLFSHKKNNNEDHLSKDCFYYLNKIYVYI